MDAVVRGLVESNKWHVAEFKTSNAKSFRDLADKGVEMSSRSTMPKCNVI